MDDGVNEPNTDGKIEAQTQRFTPSVMHGLLHAGTSRTQQQWEPPPIEVLQRALPQYEVTAFIACGGMGAVYKGIQKALHRTVAIKLLPLERVADDAANFAERFKQEARAMASLSHPNIVAVHEAGETAEGLLYFVMEFVEGTDLAQLVASEGRIDTLRALDITRQVCDALAFAHESGIVHRDIKPSNIMLDKKGRVKVADFGLAKMVQSEGTSQLTLSGTAMGTPDYMAPETLVPSMPVDQRADLYAVGVMLYQMLTGHVPRGRFAMPSAVVPGIDQRLDAIVDKAMQTDREQRYSSAVEIQAAVAKVVASFSASGTARSRALGIKPIAALLVFSVMLGGSGLVWWQLHTGIPTKTIPVLDVSPPAGPSWSKMPTPADMQWAFTNTLGMKFVPVPGTAVLFCIHETRNADYAAYATANPGVDASWQNPDRSGFSLNMGADYPVTMVNWDDAQAFCRWLSEKEGRSYRLPTDHEWSSAVGIALLEAKDESPMVKSNRFPGVYAWGRDWPPPKGAGNLADTTAEETLHWGKKIPGYTDGYATTAPVLSFSPNPLGLYDLAGNVFEWCEDWHEPGQVYKVVRGGSYENAHSGQEGRWNPSPLGDLLASRRQPGQPGSRNGVFGFRIVAEKPLAPNATPVSNAR